MSTGKRAIPRTLTVVAWQHELVKSFGEMLAKVMDVRGLDGAALSRASGVSQPTISRYLKGKRKEPSGPHLVALARVLRIDAEELLGADALPRLSHEERAELDKEIAKLDAQEALATKRKAGRKPR